MMLDAIPIYLYSAEHNNRSSCSPYATIQIEIPERESQFYGSRLDCCRYGDLQAKSSIYHACVSTSRWWPNLERKMLESPSNVLHIAAQPLLNASRLLCSHVVRRRADDVSPIIMGGIRGDITHSNRCVALQDNDRRPDGISMPGAANSPNSVVRP